jgi:hypothetical protein
MMLHKKKKIDARVFHEYEEYLRNQEQSQKDFDADVNRFSFKLGGELKYDNCYLEQVKASKHKLALENLNQSILSAATNLNNISNIQKKNNIPTKKVDDISRIPLKRTQTLHQNKNTKIDSRLTPNASPNSSFLAQNS